MKETDQNVIRQLLKQRKDYTLAAFFSEVCNDQLCFDLNPRCMYLLKLSLIFPLSVACVESLFSKMKLIKTCLQNQLGQFSLDSLLCISTEALEKFQDDEYKFFVDELKQLNPNLSLSNSNYFTSAKKCQHESCIIDFTSAKMEFTSAIFKKLCFPNIQLKVVVNRLPPFKNFSNHTNPIGNDNRKIKHYIIKKIINFKTLKKKANSKFSKVYYLQNCCISYYTFCYYHCYLALIKLLFVELGFRQIKIKYILYYYTYLQQV